MVYTYQIVKYIPFNTIAYLREKEGCIRECRCIGVEDEPDNLLGSRWEIAGFTESGILTSCGRIYVNGKEIGCLFCNETDAQFNAWYNPIEKLYKEISFSDIMARCYPSVEILTCNTRCRVMVWSVENQELRQQTADFNYYFNDNGELSVYVTELEELTCYATQKEAINHFPKLNVIRLNEKAKKDNQDKFVTIKVNKKRWDEFQKFVGSVK